MKELVSFCEKDNYLISSLTIAEKCGKWHKNVLADIRNYLGKHSELDGRQISLGEYKDKKGETKFCYLFSNETAIKFLCHYNGSKSVEFRDKLISILVGHKSAKYMLMLLHEILEITAITVPDDKYVYICKEVNSGRFRMGISKDPELMIKKLNTEKQENLILIEKYKVDLSNLQDGDIKLCHSEWYNEYKV